jgi:hypothetical protein
MNRSDQHMLRKIFAFLIAICTTAPASAQLSVSFQEGVNGYAGTVDTEFRAANPLDPQGDKGFVSIDEFDGGFQTQGALRFENLFGSQPGQVPNDVTIAFATLTVWVDSSSDLEAVIGFNRVLPASPWDESSTWFSLGGDLIPDPVTGLLDGDPILQDDVESLAVPESVVPTPEVSHTFVDIDVTDSVITWYAGAQNLGWGINNDTGNGWDFFSSEYIDPVDASDFSFRPKLTIGYQTVAGDLTGPGGELDGVVDLLDYQFLLNNLAVQLNGPINQGAFGDLDFDRDVDLTDFGIFKNLYPGGPAGLASALAAQSNVPEPAAVTLAVFALCGVGCLRRRPA